MANKTYYMRIYYRHDYDLMKYVLSLRNCQLKSGKQLFPYVIKEILRSYFRGTEYCPPRVETYTNIEAKGMINVRFSLNTTDDKDIINALSKVRTRQLNSFLKNLIRKYNDLNSLKCYFSDNKEAFPAKLLNFEAQIHVNYNNIKKSQKNIIVQQEEKISLIEANQNNYIEKESFNHNQESNVFQNELPAISNTKIDDVNEPDISENIDENFDFFAELGKMMEV